MKHFINSETPRFDKFVLIFGYSAALTMFSHKYGHGIHFALFLTAFVSFSILLKDAK